MEINLKRCKELDALHNYKHDTMRVKLTCGFHATCQKKYNAGTTVKNIVRLTRSKSFFVKSALFNLGLAEKPVKQETIRWSKEDIIKVYELADAGMTRANIAKKVGRSIESVNSLIKRIRNGDIGYWTTEKNMKAMFKICECGEHINSVDDKCNWCRRPDGTNRSITDNP